QTHCEQRAEQRFAATGHGVASDMTLAVSRFAEGIHVLLLQG
ncbi:hypothetical protein Pgy4_39570, partial [Pseudomonas savastanoi pv. glycinea str. race 4]